MGLLGHALEQAAGVGYEELLRRRLVEPLALTDTRIELPPDLSPRLAPGFFGVWHLGRLGVEIPAPRWRARVLEGAGAAVASGEDLLWYLEANLRPPANRLGDAIRRSHLRRRKREEGGGIALGWHLNPLPEGRGELIWHSGATSGYTRRPGLRTRPQDRALRAPQHRSTGRRSGGRDPRSAAGDRGKMTIRRPMSVVFDAESASSFERPFEPRWPSPQSGDSTGFPACRRGPSREIKGGSKP